MDIDNYEKVLDEHWRRFYEKELNGIQFVPNWKIFSCAFRRGYEFGKEQAGGHIPGATKKVGRNMIAAMAMQGILSNPAFCNISTKQDFVVRAALAAADALLAEFGKQGEE